MRIPEKPPSIEETNELLLATKHDPAIIDKYRPYLEEIESEYLHWDEIPMKYKGKDIDLKLLWGFVRIVRMFKKREISINGLKLTYVQTPRIEKMLHDLDVGIGGKIELETQLPVDLRKKYLVSSLMEEAIASSQLEGAATTRVVAKEMLRQNRKPRNKHERMIVNNYTTMMYIKELQKQPLTVDLIREIHRKITKETLEDRSYEGEFRNTNEIKVGAVDDGQIIYDPPDFNKVPQLLEQLCKFANSEPTNYYLNPFIKAVILHYMIGYIHPFFDGNGRTARALFYWYIITNESYQMLEYVAVSRIIKNSPGQYTRAYLFSEKDDNDVTYFVKFHLRAIELALNEFKTYIARKTEENKKILETIHQNNSLNFRQADVLLMMSKNEKPMTIKEMQERYDTTYQTARTDLIELEKQGYLNPYTRGKQFVFLLNKDKCLSKNEKK